MRRYEFYDELIARGVTSENIRIRQSVDKWNPEDDGETEEYLGRINHKIGSAEEFAYDIIDVLECRSIGIRLSRWST